MISLRLHNITLAQKGLNTNFVSFNSMIISSIIRLWVKSDNSPIVWLSVNFYVLDDESFVF